MSQASDTEKLERDAEAGSAQAQFELANALSTGHGVARDLAAARQWYWKAADQGHARASAYLKPQSHLDSPGANQAELIAWFREAAEAGNPYGCAALAHAHDFGKGVVADAAAAFDWYRKAAELGHPYSQYTLGRAYSRGIVVPEDPMLGALWFRKAADQGYGPAVYALGTLYHQGRGVPKDEGEARRLYEAALARPDLNSKTRADALAQLTKLTPQSRDADPPSATDGYDPRIGRRWAPTGLGERWSGRTAEEAWAAIASEFRDGTTPQPTSQEGPLEAALGAVQSMIGLEGVKGELSDLADFVRVQQQRKAMGLKSPPVSLHLVFTGNPGTGKTTVARHIGAIYRALGLLTRGHVVEVKREDVVGRFIGQTAPLMKARIDEALDGVLFIDEAYTLAPPHTPQDFGPEAINTLLAEMENNRGRLAVIVAGYTVEMKTFIEANPGLKSRFTRYIEFTDYSPEELAQIFISLAASEDYAIEPGLLQALRARLKEAHGARGDGRDFGNARYVRNLFEKTIQRHGRRVAKLRNPNREVLRTLTDEDFAES